MKHLSILPYGVLAISIIITIVTWAGFYFVLEDHHRNEAYLENLETVHKIEQRLSQYENILVGTKGLILASEHVTVNEWQTYVSSQKIQEEFPGIQGTGYIKYVQGEQERSRLIETMKEEGIENFKIHPEGVREKYFPVIHLEPLDIRNEQAMGYDIYSESVRAKATDLAVSSGEMAITGKIILVQEIDDDVQNGFLMLLPIFSDDEKQELLGISYTVFRINDLM